MIWYRVVRQRDISLNSDFLSGEHTKQRTYRWSSRGTAAVYVADSAETAIAECGKYWICDNAERINNSISQIKGRPPDGWRQEFQSLMSIEAYVAEIEIDDKLPCLDLSNDPPALSYFSKAGFPNLTLDEVRNGLR